MTSTEQPRVVSSLAGRAGLAPESKAGRRNQVEAVGLLLGILAILVVITLVLGVAPPA